jgi:hypothetical protein
MYPGIYIYPGVEDGLAGLQGQVLLHRRIMKLLSYVATPILTENLIHPCTSPRFKSFDIASFVTPGLSLIWMTGMYQFKISLHNGPFLYEL